LAYDWAANRYPSRPCIPALVNIELLRIQTGARFQSRTRTPNRSRTRPASRLPMRSRMRPASRLQIRRERSRHLQVIPRWGTSPCP